MKACLINDYLLKDDEVFLFKFSPKGDVPNTAIGSFKADDGSVGICLDVITNPTERDIGKGVKTDETKTVLILNFFQPESVDVLIKHATRIKDMLQEAHDES